MSKIINIPTLRFAKFTETWERRKFDNIFMKMKNNNLSRDQLNYNQGIAQNVHYGDILIKFGECLDVKIKQLPYISDHSVVDKYTKSLLENGDIIFADAAEDETVGKCTEIMGLTTEIVIAGLHTIPCRPLQKFASGYLGYYLNSRTYHDQLLPLMQGTKISSISRSSLDETYIVFPKKEEEQDQVAELFLKLENTITLHQQKYDKLVNAKKAILEKMFTQPQENIPEIRFNGFSETWEQRNFAEIAETRRGLTYSPNSVVDNGIRVLRSSNIKEDTFVFGDGDIFVDQKAVKIPFIKDGDILICSANGSNRLVGKHTIIRGLPQESAVHGGFMLAASSDKPEFVNALMNSSWYASFINLHVAGGNGAIGNLNKDDLDGQIVRIPCKKEQDKIGEFFLNLDYLITLQRNKIEKLKNLKKACLERMFI